MKGLKTNIMFIHSLMFSKHFILMVMILKTVLGILDTM